MNSDKDIELHDADDTGICLTCIENEADDPVTDVDFTGACVNRIEPDDDPITDVNYTGTSVNHIEPGDFVHTARSGNHIDAQCEGDETEGMFSFGAISYRDPLGDVELGDTDDTGICLHYIDTDIDDPVTDVNFTGTSTMHMDDDDEEPTTDVDVTGRGIAHLVQ